MFVLVWSQVQHGSGSINHVMIAIWSIGLLLISVRATLPLQLLVRLRTILA